MDFVVWGVGELGELFAGSALRLGYRVTGIRRKDDSDAILKSTGTCPILVAVGENEIDGVLGRIPANFANQVILVQNEIFPSHWHKHPHVGLPTVCVVWAVAKRKSSPLICPHPHEVCGPLADLVIEMHQAILLEARVMPSPEEALVKKFSYILTINLLGLERDVTVGEWARDEHKDRIIRMATDATRLGIALAAASGVNAQAMGQEVYEIMRSEQVSSYRAQGRTAGARLSRAISAAEQFGLRLEHLLPEK